MHSEKELDLCLKLLAQTSSELGDGATAALKLQERMARLGIDFDTLLDRVCDDVDTYAYLAEHFFTLMARVQASRNPNDTRHENDQTDATSHSSEEYRVQVRGHTRISRKGKTFTVRDHWRYCKRSAERYDWRKDPSTNPGNDYEWIDDHERWHCYAGHGKKIRVRGYWRRRARVAMKTAA
jgi:hypothetical protein